MLPGCHCKDKWPSNPWKTTSVLKKYLAVALDEIEVQTLFECWITMKSSSDISQTLRIILSHWHREKTVETLLVFGNICKYPLIPQWLTSYRTKCVGRIVTKSMCYFLHPCDCSLPYCATLEAGNWFEAVQHLNASHPRSPVLPNQNVTLFSVIFFFF